MTEGPTCCGRAASRAFAVGGSPNRYRCATSGTRRRGCPRSSLRRPDSSPPRVRFCKKVWSRGGLAAARTGRCVAIGGAELFADVNAPVVDWGDDADADLTLDGVTVDDELAAPARGACSAGRGHCERGECWARPGGIDPVVGGSARAGRVAFRHSRCGSARTAIIITGESAGGGVRLRRLRASARRQSCCGGALGRPRPRQRAVRARPTHHRARQ